MLPVTWRPIAGCSPASPGCANCAALAGAEDDLKRQGLDGPIWIGRTQLLEERLQEPAMVVAPAMVHVCDHGDLFHESTPDAWIDRVFAVMDGLPRHVFLILTKRAGRQRDYVTQRYGGRAAPAHLFFGVSAERQRELDERGAALARTPAAVRYLVLYPLLGAVDLSAHLPALDMVQAGDEPRRPADPTWFAAIEAQCMAAGKGYVRSSLLTEA